jgi:hypothetical protein
MLGLGIDSLVQLMTSTIFHVTCHDQGWTPGPSQGRVPWRHGVDVQFVTAVEDHAKARQRLKAERSREVFRVSQHQKCKNISGTYPLVNIQKAIENDH